MRRERVTGRARRGLLARVIERRRLEAPDPAEQRGSDEGRIEALERRVAHLESLIEGLQDAVHRDSVRHDDEVRELQRKTDPGEMSRSLAEHAREQGL